MRLATDTFEPPRFRKPGRLATLLWTAILTAHATAAAAWWWMMPGGFPATSQRFWINQIAPIFILMLTLTARWFWSRQRPGLLAMLLFLATMWIGIALGLRSFFPITFAWLWIGPLLIGLFMVVAARLLVKQPLNWLIRMASVLGISFGVWAAFTQKALPPATKPGGMAFTFPAEMPAAPAMIQLNDRIRVETSGATVQIIGPSAQLMIEPLLSFDSRSPDRCWALFALRSLRRGPQRMLLGAQAKEKGVVAWYESDFRQMLRVDAAEDSTLNIESLADLPHEIDSHLNTLTAVIAMSIRTPRISFSPCPQEKFDITHGGYPFGKPHRFAYLGDDGVFRVVEASNAEKGPFRTLASANLDQNQSVSFTLYDGDKPVFTIELLDWASQLSTQLSPTAGWGVPENSIEFSRMSESPKSAVSLFITLANTSVGRGFDSVGHAPGVYRNRVRVVDHTR